MNTKLYVLLAAGVLALSACKNETATAEAGSQSSVEEAVEDVSSKATSTQAALQAAQTAQAEAADHRDHGFEHSATARNAASLAAS